MNLMELEPLITKLNSNQLPDRLAAIKEIKNLGAYDQLLKFFATRRENKIPIGVEDGKIYQILLENDPSNLGLLSYAQFLDNTVLKVNYEEIYNLLAKQDYQTADALTTKKLSEAAGENAAQRGWLYFTEVDAISKSDLQTIDQLWLIFSEGKFGFSIQRKLWLNLGKNWEKLWQQIQWKQDGSFTRYPDGFSWSGDAPRGHLPLSNQIRGNKTLEAIFNHPAWN